jgi:hypothetical protein
MGTVGPSSRIWEPSSGCKVVIGPVGSQKVKQICTNRLLICVGCNDDFNKLYQG